MGVKFQNKQNQLQYPFSTSWGTSTRTIGALALTHTDNYGLILPFAVAPVQIAFILIGENQELINYYQEILNILVPARFRCRLYNNFSQADKEGCPLKIVLGAEELKKGEITLIRRDNIEKKIIINILAKTEFEAKFLPIIEDYAEKTSKINLENLEDNKKLSSLNVKEQMVESIKNGFKQGRIYGAVNQAREELNQNLYQKSVDFRDQHIFSVSEYQTLEKKIRAGTIGLFLIPFCNNLTCEETIAPKLPAYSIRCLSWTAKPKGEEKCIFCALPTVNYAYLGRSY
ncbi:14351_t:CDS:1 [Funneliformis geosporum]|nr:14351_t:CDS:1 [Funneliformis geosporum]